MSGRAGPTGESGWGVDGRDDLVSRGEERWRGCGEIGLFLGPIAGSFFCDPGGEECVGQEYTTYREKAGGNGRTTRGPSHRRSPGHIGRGSKRRRGMSGPPGVSNAWGSAAKAAPTIVAAGGDGRSGALSVLSAWGSAAEAAPTRTSFFRPSGACGSRP
jgi:hypothetical protein